MNVEGVIYRLLHCKYTKADALSTDNTIIFHILYHLLTVIFCSLLMALVLETETSNILRANT